MTKDISYFSLLYLAILILPIYLFNLKFRIGINKRMLYAIARMVVQLSMVGIFLQYIFELDNPVINTLYILVMVVIASISTVKSCEMDMKRMLLIIIISFGIPNIGALLFFNTLILDLDNVFQAQYFIPIIGMLLGNSLNGNIIGINSFYAKLKNNEKEYHYRLCLSGNKLESFMPYYKEAVLSSTNPTLASLETIGIVSLPGMMTGQILGGSVPMTAIKYQIAIMVAIFAVRYFSIHFSLLLTAEKSFNEFGILKK